jgi:hypothetical protein
MTSRRQTSSQPPLADLLAGYLRRQAVAHADGVGYAPPAGEVVPYDLTPAQPVDPRLAWQETVAVLRTWQPTTADLPAPPEWPTLVTAHEPAAAVALCCGNFPQLVRDLHPILQAPDLAALRPTGNRPVAVPSLLDWAAQQTAFPQVLPAVGALRLARQFDAAAELLHRPRAAVPVPWQAAWANEEAALAWHRGRHEEAAALWQEQPESLAVLFNRGMAALFLGGSGEARAPLSAAIARLPEESGWHHLGCLYLALAEMRPSP